MTINIAKLSKLPAIYLGYIIDPETPVIPLSMDITRAVSPSPHKHPRGQLVYASEGVMRLVCEDHVYLVPPSQALWIPPDVEHMAYFPGKVSLRNLFVDPSAITGMPVQCTVLRVTPLLKELILKAMTVEERYAEDSPEWRLVQVILDELRNAGPEPLWLPMARDGRARRVMEALIQNPADKRTLSEWSEIAFASPRTLARIFERETGMSFGDWRRQLRLLEAVDRLSKGRPVTNVAFELGYDSPSAFIEMFRKALGRPPGKYFDAPP